MDKENKILEEIARSYAAGMELDPKLFAVYLTGIKNGYDLAQINAAKEAS